MMTRIKSINPLPHLISLALLILLMLGCKDDDFTTDNLNFDNERNGCANFLLYTIDNNSSLAVTGDRDLLNLDLTIQEFNLPHPFLEVSLNEFDGDIGNFYCDDVAGDEGEIVNTYIPLSGIAEIQITEDSIEMNDPFIHYKISVHLKDLEFEVDGKTSTYDQIDFDNILVGWFPG